MQSQTDDVLARALKERCDFASPAEREAVVTESMNRTLRTVTEIFGSDVAARFQPQYPATTLRNAQMASALLGNRNLSEYLILLKFRRDPAEFHDQLKTCSELRRCREDLEAHGKCFRLKSGGYVFVRPDQYDAAEKWAELHGGLIPQQVIVSQDYEADVMKAIERFPCNSRVRVQQKSKVPYGVVSEAVSSGIELSFERTFIHIHVPNSLRSSSSGHAVVASTTEAHGGSNPRRV